MGDSSIGFGSLFVPCWYSRKVLRAGTFPANMFLLFNSAILLFVRCFSQHWLETHVSSISMNFGHFRKVQIHTNMLVATSRNIFAGNVPARNAFRGYQQGTNNDVDPVEIPLMPIESPLLRMAQRQRQQISPEIPPPNNPGYRRHHNEQVMTHHKDQQFDHQPIPQTDMYTTRASSAPPSNPPPYTPDINDNPECWNDVQGCVCASDPRYHRQCMQDMSNVQL